MKITSDRWHMVSLPIILFGILYLAAGRFNRHTTADLAVASLMTWDAIVLCAFYLWWWPRRRAFEAVAKVPAPRARMVAMSSILTSVVASVGLMVGGIALLEQDSLRLQAPGVLLLVMAALMFPGWSVWFIRWTIRRTNAASV